MFFCNWCEEDFFDWNVRKNTQETKIAHSHSLEKNIGKIAVMSVRRRGAVSVQKNKDIGEWETRIEVKSQVKYINFMQLQIPQFFSCFDFLQSQKNNSDKVLNTGYGNGNLAIHD